MHLNDPRMICRVIVLLLLSTLLSISIAAELETDKQKLGYVMGTLFGKDLKLQSIDIDLNSLFEGIEDSLKGKELKIDMDNAEKILAKFRSEKEAEFLATGMQNKEKGKHFLTRNATKDGVKTNQMGLQYKVLKEGNGSSPNRASRISVHYIGKTLDGSVFENTYEDGAPRETYLHSLIPGLQLAVMQMKEGAKWKVFVPSDMAYRREGRFPDIGPHETLIYDVKLISSDMRINQLKAPQKK